MLISKIDCQYIKENVVPKVTFENVGKPCNFFNCIQTDSVNTVRKMWEDKKYQSVNNHVWSCALGITAVDDKKYALRSKEFPEIKKLLQKHFSNNPVVQNIVRDELEFGAMTVPLLAAALEWMAYGDNPKHVWFRSMIPIFLAGHLVCGFAGKRKRMHPEYMPEPVYYVY